MTNIHAGIEEGRKKPQTITVKNIKTGYFLNTVIF
jgi:hypothetical protein